MDSLTFIATVIPPVIGALAWPVAVVIIALRYRKELLERLPPISSLAWGSARAEFAKAVDSVAARAAKAKLPAAGDAGGPVVFESGSMGEALKRFQQELRERAALNRWAVFNTSRLQSWVPRIFESWHLVESALRNAADRLGLHVPPDADVQTLLSRLVQAGALTEDMRSTILGLWALHNAAVHAPPEAIPPMSAQDYAKLADRATSYLDSLRPARPAQTERRER